MTPANEPDSAPPEGIQRPGPSIFIAPSPFLTACPRNVSQAWNPPEIALLNDADNALRQQQQQGFVQVTSQPSEKKCTKCSQVKTMDNFRRDQSKVQGYQSWCKLCCRAHTDLKSHEPVMPELLQTEFQCRICKASKPLREFTKDPRRPGGRESRCKACRRRLKADIAPEKLCGGCNMIKSAAGFKRKELERPAGRCKQCCRREALADPARRVMEPTLAEKQCLSCQVLKPAVDFTLDSRKKTGLGSRCKPCEAEHCRLKRRRRQQHQQQGQGGAAAAADSEEGDEETTDDEVGARLPELSSLRSQRLRPSWTEAQPRLALPQADGMQHSSSELTQQLQFGGLLPPPLQHGWHQADGLQLEDLPGWVNSSGGGEMMGSAWGVVVDSPSAAELAAWGAASSADAARMLAAQPSPGKPPWLQQSVLLAGPGKQPGGQHHSDGQEDEQVPGVRSLDGPALIEKQCSRCFVTRPAAEFTRDARRRFGLGCHCLGCEAEYCKEKRQRRMQQQRQHEEHYHEQPFLSMLLHTSPAADMASPSAKRGGREQRQRRRLEGGGEATPSEGSFQTASSPGPTPRTTPPAMGNPSLPLLTPGSGGCGSGFSFDLDDSGLYSLGSGDLPSPHSLAQLVFLSGESPLAPLSGQIGLACGDGTKAAADGDQQAEAGTSTGTDSADAGRRQRSRLGEGLDVSSSLCEGRGPGNTPDAIAALGLLCSLESPEDLGFEGGGHRGPASALHRRRRKRRNVGTSRESGQGDARPVSGHATSVAVAQSVLPPLPLPVEGGDSDLDSGHFDLSAAVEAVECRQAGGRGSQGSFLPEPLPAAVASAGPSRQSRAETAALRISREGHVALLPCQPQRCSEQLHGHDADHYLGGSAFYADSPLHQDGFYLHQPQPVDSREAGRPSMLLPSAYSRDDGSAGPSRRQGGGSVISTQASCFEMGFYQWQQAAEGGEANAPVSLYGPVWEPGHSRPVGSASEMVLPVGWLPPSESNDEFVEFASMYLRSYDADTSLHPDLEL